MTPPSNLPSANQLRESVVEKLFDADSLEPEARTRLVDGYVKEKGKDALGFSYPFEAFLQTLDENARILDTLVQICRSGKRRFEES